MNRKYWIRQLRSSAHLSEQLRAVRRLRTVQDLPEVTAALCLTAVDTQRQSLRAALMAALRDNPRAEAYFLGVAGGDGPVFLRKWALLNLSLMGSRRAREVVLAALRDPFESVRRAAAYHVALYTDEEARSAFIGYFEANRSICLKDFMAQVCLPLRQLYREVSALRITADTARLQPVAQVRG